MLNRNNKAARRFESVTCHRRRSMYVRMRLMATPWMVRQIQSEGQTRSHRRRPNVDPTIDFFRLCLFIWILSDVLVEQFCLERANGLVSHFPMPLLTFL